MAQTSQNGPPDPECLIHRGQPSSEAPLLRFSKGIHQDPEGTQTGPLRGHSSGTKEFLALSGCPVLPHQASVRPRAEDREGPEAEPGGPGHPAAPALRV